MAITLAKEAGFCFGVKLALDKIRELIQQEDVYVLGKLIHNPQVLEELKAEGIKFVDSLDDIKSGTVVISAHGVADKVKADAETRGLNVIDTTCPLVTKVHNITKRLEKDGRRIVIYGEKDHTEVKGIKGNLNNAIVIDSLEELDGVDLDKIALVSQTTQDVSKFKDMGDDIPNKIGDVVVKDTICSATKERQHFATELAKEVDIMIVIGGHNSGNTNRLREVCAKDVEAHHIETPAEIKKEWFDGKDNIGVTAGASTPDKMINKVIEEIKNITGHPVTP